MEDTKLALLGVQATLGGLFLVTFFEGVGSYPLVGLLLGVVGTVTVVAAVFDL